MTATRPTHATRRACAAAIAAACLLATLCAAPTFAADVQRVEVIGATALGGERGGRRSPRDRALRLALHEAVYQVASRELAGDPVPPTEEQLTAALGEDPFEYASRFRVLEDRGEQPAQRPEDPSVTHEYVVLAEVHVDAVRVRKRLAEAGLLVVPSGEIGGAKVRVAVVDLSNWNQVQAVRKLLRDVGAANAVPIEVKRGRAVLEVESRRSPERLLQELVRRAPDSLEIQALGADQTGLRLRARVLESRPPAAPDAAAAFDTPEAERY